MSNACTPINECIACSHSPMVPLLDLGKQPLANSFKATAEEVQTEYPLAINRCTRCFHVQLSHKVDPKLLFDNYLYVSGTSDTHLRYFKWFARFASENRNAFYNNVLDIGCNDGSQLDAFAAHDPSLKTYGIDPAQNLHPVSSKNHNTVCAFFSGHEFGKMKFDTIVCQNAFPHNYNQAAFLTNVRKVMHDGSLLFISTSQANMILNGEFDTIYHEHLSFYNIQSMAAACRYAGLHLVDVVKHPIHGASYIFVISLRDLRPAHVENLIGMEYATGLYDEATYEAYATRCGLLLTNLRIQWAYLKEKMPIVGYGAAAKGNTLLNSARVKPAVIIDDNPLKRGLYTPGMSVRVEDINHLREAYGSTEAICFVPLAWNFYEEIVAKIKAVRPHQKDTFLRYFPKVETC